MLGHALWNASSAILETIAKEKEKEKREEKLQATIAAR